MAVLRVNAAADGSIPAPGTLSNWRETLEAAAGLSTVFDSQKAALMRFLTAIKAA